MLEDYESLVEKAKEYEELARTAKRQQKKEYKRLAQEYWRKALRLKYKFGGAEES